MEKENPCRRNSLPKLPPKSRFNDEESTAVLRLLLKQQKLLNNKDDNPALKIVPGKSSKRLPPVCQHQGGTYNEDKMFGDDQPTMDSHQNKCRNTLSSFNVLPLPGSAASMGTSEGIFRSPKLARPKERPKGSYGRRQYLGPQQKCLIEPQEQLQKQLESKEQEEPLQLQQKQNLQRKNLHEEELFKWQEETTHHVEIRNTQDDVHEGSNTHKSNQREICGSISSANFKKSKQVFLRTKSCPEPEEISKYTSHSNKDKSINRVHLNLRQTASLPSSEFDPK